MANPLFPLILIDKDGEQTRVLMISTIHRPHVARFELAL